MECHRAFLKELRRYIMFVDNTKLGGVNNNLHVKEDFKRSRQA